jgi:hypothetical protein
MYTMKFLTISPVAAYSSKGACGKKVVNIVCTQYRMLALQSKRWTLRPTLDLDSDKFRCFDQSQGRTRQRSTASKLQIGRSWYTILWNACYIQRRKLLFIHGTMYPKKTREVRPAVLIREGNMQFVKYLLDTRLSSSMHIFTDF